MGWQSATAVALPKSHSRITNLPGFSVITEQEARRFRQIVDSGVTADIEADAVNFDTGSEIIYSYTASGFIHSDDWSALSADAMLKAIRANDDAANLTRVAKGFPTLRTIGWIRPPTLNNDTHMVSWIIEGASSDGSGVINAVALKLGRSGFERIVWVIDPKSIGNGQNDLALAADAHRFDENARYEDYRPGTDRAAEYGVAGLVAAALGVKLAQAAGIGATLAVIGKKGAFILVLPAIWLWRKLTGKSKSVPNA